MKKILLSLFLFMPLVLMAKGASANMVQDIMFAILVAGILIGIGVLLHGGKKLKEQVDIWDGILPQEPYEFPEVETQNWALTAWEKTDISFFARPAANLYFVGREPWKEGEADALFSEADTLYPRQKGLSWALREGGQEDASAEICLHWNSALTHEAHLEVVVGKNEALAHAFEGIQMAVECLQSPLCAQEIRRVETWIKPGEQDWEQLLEILGFRAEGILRQKIMSETGPQDIQLFSLILPDRSENNPHPSVTEEETA
ncbi:MAG: hypothetical protein AAFR61_17425 [Bacteroidota bacterium]